MCYCGATFGNYGKVYNNSECNTLCSGDSISTQTICGGILKNSIYQIQSSNFSLKILKYNDFYNENKF